MRRVLRNTGILSIENQDPNAPASDSTAPVADVQAAEAGEELANGIVEMTESEVEGQDREDQIEAGGEIVTALENLAVMAHDAARGQGFSRETAQVVSMYINDLRSRAKDRSPSKMPSLESFGATTSRIRGTNLSLEEIGDMAKRAWDAIVEKVKAAMKWIRDHFLKVFGNAERMVKRAEAMEARIEAVKGKPEQGVKIDNAALYKKLHIGGDVSADKSGDLAKVVPEFLTHAFSITGTLETAIENGLKSATGGVAFTTSSFSKVSGFADTAVPDSYKEIAANNGTEVVGSAALPGDQVIIAVAPTAGLTGADALKALAATRAVVDSVKGSKDPSKTELEILDRAKATKICGDIKNLAQALVQSRKSIDDVNKKRDSLERALESFAREFEKADKPITGATGTSSAGNSNSITADDQKKNASAAKSLAMKLPTIIDYGVAAATSYAINTGSAYLDWVAFSLRKYKDA